MSSADISSCTEDWGGSAEAARAIVPVVLELAAPRSVIDVGCGDGSWLSAFIQHGIDDVLGMDASHVQPQMLSIPVENFTAVDLRQSVSLPRRFDLALSLEVAEHLPPDRAPGFVSDLVALARIVLFSAAIPGQGGTGHLNEQWPDYWAELFEQHSYRVVDAIRWRFWDEPDVPPWYAQNAFLFVADDHLSRTPRLAEEHSQGIRMPLSVVHPRTFEDGLQEAAIATPSIPAAIRRLVRAVGDSLRRRLRI